MVSLKFRDIDHTTLNHLCYVFSEIILVFKFRIVNLFFNHNLDLCVCMRACLHVVNFFLSIILKYSHVF